MDDYFAIINNKNKPGFFHLDYFVSLASTGLQQHRIGCIYLSSKCSNNNAHFMALSDFKKGEMRWLSILTDKDLKTKHKED